MSTEEQNKLIAIFDGAEKSKVDNDTRYLRFPEPKGGTYAFYASDLKYHSDWNWLMPAISKFNLLDSDELFKNISSEYYKIRQSVDAAVCTYEIAESFRVFVFAIQWLNTQNK